jgi:hypothetical protein
MIFCLVFYAHGRSFEAPDGLFVLGVQVPKTFGTLRFFDLAWLI